MKAAFREIRDVIRASAVVEGLTPLQMLGQAALGMAFVAGGVLGTAILMIAMGANQ